MKMAQKRAFVGAVSTVTGASEFFTQDVEDMEITNVPFEVVNTEVKQPATTQESVKTAKQIEAEKQKARDDIAGDEEKPQSALFDGVGEVNEGFVQTDITDEMLNKNKDKEVNDTMDKEKNDVFLKRFRALFNKMNKTFRNELEKKYGVDVPVGVTSYSKAKEILQFMSERVEK
jgi:hypothetical protein